MGDDLAGMIAAAIGNHDGALEAALFGSDDPAAVAEALTRHVRHTLGEPVAALFYRAGVGVVAGLELATGAQIVVKVHRWNVSLERLSSIQRVQAHLASCGLAAPRPLGPPALLGSGIATVEAYRAGERADGHLPAVRQSLAYELHRFIVAATPLREVGVGPPIMLRPDAAPLWPEPHSLRFDFSATAAGAEWIDAAAITARRRLAAAHSAPASVGHFDWRTENLAFEGNSVAAIYDWDSVVIAPESVTVGVTAAQFCSDWSAGHPVPAVDETVAFVDAYEQVRDKRFTPGERRLLDAANLALIAYGARCQHSDRQLHPALAGTPGSAWLGLLRDRGDGEIFGR